MVVKLLPTVERLPEPLRRFMAQITDEQKLLLVLKRELYDRDWAPMITDLQNRLEGRPYVLTLAHRIEDDLERIEKMRNLEQQHGVDLSDYIQSLEDLINTERSA